MAGKEKRMAAVFGLLILLGICIAAGVRSAPVQLQEASAAAYNLIEEHGAGKNPSEETADGDDLKGNPSGETADGEDPEEKQEQAVSRRTTLDPPGRVAFLKPVVKEGSLEGEMSYRWPDQCIEVDDTTVLVTGDCFYLDGLRRQKMFFIAEAPDFALREVYRHEYKEVPEVVENYADRYDFVNERMASPIRLEDGYVYEADGRLYHLSRDFQETDEICNLRQIMGDRYQLYYKGAYENTCDISSDLNKLLACTNDGLYEYDLRSGEAKLLEAASFEPHTVILEEGDCGCATPEYDFIGPLRAEYAPDGRGYVFVTVDATEDVWGEITGIVLRDGDGETLYEKQLDEYYGDFRWLEAQENDYLAVFYEEEEQTWMDLVAADTGESVTYKVPDRIFSGDSDEGGVALIDENRLLCRIYDWDKDTTSYSIYQLQEGKPAAWEQTEGEIGWKVKVIAEGSYYSDTVKYPEPAEP